MKPAKTRSPQRDDESRLLMIRGQITEVAYNVQTTVDSKHNLVIDVKAVNTNDKKMACEMGRRAQSNHREERF